MTIHLMLVQLNVSLFIKHYTWGVTQEDALRTHIVSLVAFDKTAMTKCLNDHNSGRCAGSYRNRIYLRCKKAVFITGICRGYVHLRHLSTQAGTFPKPITNHITKTGLFWGPYKEICVKRLEGASSITATTQVTHFTSQKHVYMSFSWPKEIRRPHRDREIGSCNWWALSASSHSEMPY